MNEKEGEVLLWSVATSAAEEGAAVDTVGDTSLTPLESAEVTAWAAMLGFEITMTPSFRGGSAPGKDIAKKAARFVFDPERKNPWEK